MQVPHLFFSGKKLLRLAQMCSSKTLLIAVLLVITVAITKCQAKSSDCVLRDFGEGNKVCVCNANYCDRIKPVTRLPRGQFWSYTSTKEGLRFARQFGTFNETVDADFASVVVLNRSLIRQTIKGFGGSFTDAFGINVKTLSSGAQKKLMDSYFSPNGIGYTLCRVPIGGTDFSTRPYTYDDDHPGDHNLTYFKLAKEDLKYKIPLIQRAISTSDRKIQLIASSWSAPAWMKTSDNIIFGGSFKGKTGGLYYQTWANYYVKFFKEYAAHNITFWAMTAQNEPTSGTIIPALINSMTFSSEQQRIFIGQNLGPTLKQNGLGHLKIIILDDTRLHIYQWAKEAMEDDDARRYVSGVAFHWYINFIAPATEIDRVHDSFPNLLVLSTEASSGTPFFFWQNRVIVGSWQRGEDYAFDIIDDLEHWTQGWIDWNMALDMSGGPNWAVPGNDSPILIDASRDEFYKQPMFYAMGHFSKFVKPGSVMIGMTTSDEKFWISSIAFLNLEDMSTTLVILNRGDDVERMTVKDPDFGILNLTLQPHSFQTFVWWN